MKTIMTIFFMLLSIVGISQDGLYFFSQQGKKDTIVSLYNSSVNERIAIGDSLVTRIKKGYIKADQDFYLVLKNGTKIEGKVYISETRKYILFDLYVIVIKYPNGTFYRSMRFLKLED